MTTLKGDVSFTSINCFFRSDPSHSLTDSGRVVSSTGTFYFPNRLVFLSCVAFDIDNDALNPLTNQMFTFKCSHLPKEKKTEESALWRLLAVRSDAAIGCVSISNEESSTYLKLLLLPRGFFLFIQELIATYNMQV